MAYTEKYPNSALLKKIVDYLQIDLESETRPSIPFAFNAFFKIMHWEGLKPAISCERTIKDKHKALIICGYITDSDESGEYNRLDIDAVRSCLREAKE